MVSNNSWWISGPYRWLSDISSFFNIVFFLCSIIVAHEVLNVDGKGSEASKAIHELVINSGSRDNFLILLFLKATFGEKADILFRIFL